MKNVNINEIENFIFDMDGTILDDKKQLSQENISAIKFLQDNNKKVIIATGRPIFINKEYFEKLNISDFVIGINGAIVSLNWRKNKNEIISYLPKDTFQKLVLYLHENKIDFLTYTEKFLYGFNFNNPIWFENRIYSQIQKDNPYKFKYYENNLEKLFSFLEKEKFLKILILKDKTSQEKLDNFLNYLLSFDDIYYLQSQSDVIDIMAKGTSKGKTIIEFFSKYNLDLNKTMAFGDENNDIEMLQNVKYGIAMLNAHNNLKEVTKYITEKDNNSSGIADFIWNLTKTNIEDKIKKFKVNHINNKWWFEPSICSLSFTNWAYKPFNTFDEFLKSIKMQDRPIYISLNSDKEFLLFNQVQRQYNKTLRLNKNLVLSKKEIYLKLTENIYIYLDEKAIKDIKKGYQFAFPTKYFEEKTKELNLKLKQDLVYVFKYSKFDFKLFVKRKNNFI
ncbi:HAD family hydrolase [Mycoplasmopsis synoviae]|uniref:HAD family hydrolase n=1 Tax=Mycoplasmopsis synoviae TaxID=2109 RepID=UPI00349EB1EA